jgi:hypothetical protein
LFTFAGRRAAAQSGDDAAQTAEPAPSIRPVAAPPPPAPARSHHRDRAEKPAAKPASRPGAPAAAKPGPTQPAAPATVEKPKVNLGI